MAEVILVGEPLGLFAAQEYGNLKDVSVFKRSIAGAELNVGIGLSRLGISVEYVSKIGNDPIGQFIFESIQDMGIGTHYINCSQEKQTGLMMKSRVSSGDPKIAYYRSNSAFTNLCEEDVKDIDFSEVRVLHITGIPLAINRKVRQAVLSLVKRAKAAHTLITFDPNIRKELWTSGEEMINVLKEFASYSDVVLPGIKEGELLTGSEDADSIMDFYMNNGSSVVIIKDGPKGAIVKEKNREKSSVQGFPVETIVDTVGAGDGFAAGVIYGYLKGSSWEETALYANAIGSLQVQHQGDNEGMPDEEKLKSYIAGFKEV